ncbi:MAG: hypothetical protein ABIK09_07150 [Pseudomonadota bacterium]
MDTPFLRLRDRTDELGKHHRRFLVFISRHMRNLVDRLEVQGTLDQVNLWSLSTTVEDELKIVADAGREERESRDFMACYYALQFLQSNVIALDKLALDLADPERLDAGYRGFIQFQDGAAHRLHGGYIGALLERTFEDVPHPEYAVCVVGTRFDQDDLDLGVIHDGEEGLVAYKKGLTRTVNEMFRHGIQPHLYISERLGLNGYSATLQEYQSRVSKGAQDYVMTSELLSAQLLTGSRDLFQRFQNDVVGRYYERTGLGLRYHEGYLRGLLGDMQALLVRDVHRDRLHFKEDALRLSKGLLYAGKVIHEIRVADPFEICEALRKKVPRRAEEYSILESAMMMIEIFRHLYQLHSVQEEVVQVGTGDEDPVLDQVAMAMGYTLRGGVRPRDQLLVHYYARVHDIRTVAGRIFADLTRYLRGTSLFTSSFRDGGDVDITFGGDAPGQNLARELSEAVRMFGGQAFWEDVIAELKRDDYRLARRLARDIQRLQDDQREDTLENFLLFGAGEPVTLMSFMLTLREGGGVPGGLCFRDLVERFFARSGQGGEFVEGFCHLFQTRPQLVNRFIQGLEKDQREALERLLEEDPWDESLAEVLQQIRRFIRLRTAGSEFYRRIFRRVVSRHPEFIHHVGDIPRLLRYASGLLAPVDDARTYGEKRLPLADYYDLQYLACAVSAVDAEDPLVYRPRFVEFADTYIRAVYSVALKEELAAMESPPVTRDLFALFATGGYAREQAFDDDYDLLPILNTDDPEIVAVVGRAWRRVHREIVRRGTIPQYRFSDHFGEYVVHLDQLVEFFRSGRADVVDLAQLIGLRLVVGSSRMTAAVSEQIVHPYIFSDAAGFVRKISREMQERHEFSGLSLHCVEIKEGSGGLRDVEQVLLVLNARYQVMEPVTLKLFEMLSVLAEEYAGELEILARHHTFLREVRDLYRITVAATDTIQLEYLDPVAAVLHRRDPEHPRDPAALFAQIINSMERVASATHIIIHEVGDQ